MAFAGTKQVYHASPEQVIYIVPAKSILGRLALVPVGEHGTIPASLSANSSAFKRGKCDEQGRPGFPWNRKQALLYQLVGYDMALRPSIPKKEDH